MGGMEGNVCHHVSRGQSEGGSNLDIQVLLQRLSANCLESLKPRGSLIISGTWRHSQEIPGIFNDQT